MATTLVAISLALVLGLALSSASLTHLHQSSQLLRQSRAQSAAEAVLAEAQERLLSEPEFGLSEGAGKTLSLSFSESQATLSFDESVAASQDMPKSTSNRFNLEPQLGWQDSVLPPHSVQLYASGECAGTRVVLECMVRAPDFPYVVASSGPVDSSGALTVGVVEDFESILDQEALRSAALVAGGDVQIDGQAKIVGSVESTQSISLASSVELQGEMRPHSEPLELQDLDVPSLRPVATVPLTDTIAPELSGHFHHNGPEVRINQGLTLDDSILYINGNTHISGGIHGKGAVIVNGDLTVEGSSTLLADTQLALVCQGDLTITGQSQDGSFFQGLIYTEGDFFGEDVTLVGAFMANRNESAVGAGSHMEFHNTKLISLADYSKFDLESEAFTVWGTKGRESQGGQETLTLVEVDERAIPVLEEGVKLVVTGTSGGEGDMHGNGEVPDRMYTIQPSLDAASVAAVSRARRATVVDGKIVSDWEELDEAEITGVIDAVQGEMLPEQHNGTPPATITTRPIELLSYQAEVGSLFWEISRASLHLDFNEFLGQNERLRVSSWRKL